MSSPSCAGLNTPPTLRAPWPTRPNSDSPAGKPTAIITTRTVCTMAMARMSASSSAASPITCDRPPGRRREVCGHLVPAVHRAQIGGPADADADHGRQQHGDAQRIGRHAVQRRRRDHGAERNADQHQQNAHRQRRHQHRPPGERGGGHHQDRTRQKAGRHPQEAEREPADGGKDQRFRKVAGDGEAVGGGLRGQGLAAFSANAWRAGR